jgi:glycerophosphoryl diester phosphodiesterase
VVREPLASPRRDFYSIAHRAGNNLTQTEIALKAGVDAIECDFWHARGRLALRHERKLPGLPILYDKWFVRWTWGELSLRHLLRAINRRAELFLDIKSASSRAADAVLELYRDHESLMPKTLVCSKQWSVLDRIARAGTDMEMYYSIGRYGGIPELLARAKEPLPPAGTSIRHTRLSREVVARFHDEGMRVFAWTVNNRERAEELVDWGVDGLISDDLDVFALDPTSLATTSE